MKWVEPEVCVVANTCMDEGVGNYFESLGVPVWATNAKSNSETLIEIGGRMCYRAFGTELNANLTKVREGNLQYIQNIVKQGHGSICVEQFPAVFADFTRSEDGAWKPLYERI